MKTIFVKTQTKKYPILIGRGVIRKVRSAVATAAPSKVLIVTQKKIAAHYLKPLLKDLKNLDPGVHYVPDGETAKSEKELFRLYVAMLARKMDRSSLVVALGGGVVGDLAGYAAASFLRGIRFINIGTTLLAQVDSSIGGKTGINLKQGKNLVGAFYQPDAVFSDADVLRTLPRREYIASLAEVIKYGVIRSPQLFSFLEKNVKAILRRNPRALEKIIYESSRIKAGVVSRDEHETQGERMILNFGHTFGHGFEQASGYKSYLHGEAVAMGMACAARLAVYSGLLDIQYETRLLRLLHALGLPVRLKKPLRIESVMNAMRRDKKNTAGAMHFVLPVRLGSVVLKKGFSDYLIQKIIGEAGGV